MRIIIETGTGGSEGGYRVLAADETRAGEPASALGGGGADRGASGVHWPRGEFDPADTGGSASGLEAGDLDGGPAPTAEGLDRPSSLETAVDEGGGGTDPFSPGSGSSVGGSKPAADDRALDGGAAPGVLAADPEDRPDPHDHFFGGLRAGGPPGFDVFGGGGGFEA